MKGLFIDTASQIHTIGVYNEKNKVLSQMNWKGARDETETLIKNIAEVLKKAKVAPSKVGEIISVVGPGPFSAIRIGVTTANTFAYVLNATVSGISMQDYWWMRRPQSPAKKSKLIMLMHAGTHSVSCTIDGEAEKLLNWEEIWHLPDVPTLFFGDLTEEEMAILRQKLKSKWEWTVESELITWQDICADIRSVGQPVESDAGVHPLYYRPPHITSPKNVP